MTIIRSKRKLSFALDSLEVYISEDTMRDEFVMKDGTRDTRKLNQTLKKNGIDPKEGYAAESRKGWTGQFFIQTTRRRI